MKENKFFLKHGVHLASLCAVLALLFFIPAGILKSGAKVLFIVLMVLFLVAGGVILYLAHREKGERVHYFLYDRRRGANLPTNALSGDLVKEGIDRYLSDYTASVCDLWRDIPKKLRLQLEGDAPFKPLIAYRMLLELSTKEAEDILSTFTDADDRAVGYLCRAIRDVGDADMADYIFELKKSARENRTRIPIFFNKNRRLFEERMLRFVERHISDFYMDKARMK